MNRKYFKDTHDYIICETVIDFLLLVSCQVSRTKLSLVCPVCNRVHNKSSVGYVRKKGSSICSKCANRHNISGEKFGMLEAIKPDLSHSPPRWVCKCDCGTVGVYRYNNLSSGQRVSCGCLQRSRTNKNGSSHRGCSRYSTWRMNVLSRDSFRCVVCNESKGIVAHHINSFSSFPDMRYDKDNGATLCKRCHYNFHIKFMGGWNVPCERDDYVNWMGSFI